MIKKNFVAGYLIYKIYTMSERTALLRKPLLSRTVGYSQCKDFFPLLRREKLAKYMIKESEWM